MDYEKIFNDLRIRSVHALENRLKAQESGDFFRILQLEIELNECRYELLRFTCKKSYLPADLQFLSQLGLQDEPIPDRYIQHKFCNCLKTQDQALKFESDEQFTLSKTDSVKDDSQEDVTPDLRDHKRIEKFDLAEQVSTKRTNSMDLDREVTALDDEVTSLSLASKERTEEKSPVLSKVYPEKKPQNFQDIHSDDKDSSTERSQGCSRSPVSEVEPEPGPSSSSLHHLNLVGIELREPPVNEAFIRDYKSSKSINHVLRSLRSKSRPNMTGVGIMERRVVKMIRQAPSRRVARLIRYTFESFGSRTRETDILDVHSVLRLLSG